MVSRSLDACHKTLPLTLRHTSLHSRVQLMNKFSSHLTCFLYVGTYLC